MGIRTRRARAHAKTHIIGFSAAGVLGFLVLLVIALAVSLGALVESWLQDLPDYTSADAYLVAEPSRVYDAQGNTIATFYLENRRSVDMDAVSDYVLKGTVDVEDERFYQHNGIDPAGIVRAVFSQLAGRSEGASTITQQLVRNTVLSDEQFDKTLKRKVREAYIAVEMEKTYSKDQILMMYLNTIYYGHGAYGIEAASITYFNKHASDLTLAEAATLVGLPNSPSYYDPTVNPDAAKERRNKVLDNMLRLGDITQEEHDAAQAEDLVLNLGNTYLDSQGTYPFWTNYVKGLLEGDFSQDTIVQSGLNIYTTIDPAYQNAAQDSVTRMLDETGNSTLESALVAIDPNTGYIKAMVGGRDFYGSQADAQVNAATSEVRQTGSTFKTFTLVAALKAGMNPNIYVNCNSPIQVSNSWKVQNFGGTSYGNQTLTMATTRSLNTGYVQVGMAVGVDQVIQTAKDMGVSANLEPYGSTILGTNGTSPLEMAEAYAVLANGGTHRDPVAITKITDRNGNTVYEHEDSPTQVLDAGVAKVATDTLENVISNRYGTAYSMSGVLKIDQPVAGKTGTTDNGDNLWFVGYTPQLAVACWTGYKTDTRAVYRGNGASAHPADTSCLSFAYFVNAMLADTPRAEWPMKDAPDPTYKDNSSWKFSNTSAGANSGRSSGAADEETAASSAAASSEAASSPAADDSNGGGTNGGGSNGGGTISGGGNSGNGGNGGNGGGGNSGNGGGGAAQSPTSPSPSPSPEPGA